MSTINVSGSLAYDRIMNFPGKFRDHIHEDKMHVLSVSFVVNTLEVSFGGTAGNIAYSLALLGEHAKILAAAGADFSSYQERLQKQGNDISTIQRELSVATPTGHIITDEEDNQITAFYLGAMGHSYTKEIPKADLAIVAAGNRTDMNELPKKYRANGTPYFFDPGQMLTVLDGNELREAIVGCEAVFGNDYELHMLLTKTGWSKDELLEKVAAIITTLGAEGTRITTKNGEAAVPAVSAIEVLDPTGAGDAYRAGFAVGWLSKLPYETCAKLGSAVAVHAVEAYGTQRHVFTMEHLKKRYEEAFGESFPKLTSR